MKIEALIFRRLLISFFLSSSVLFVWVVWMDASLRLERARESAERTHKIFERLVAGYVRTHDVPELMIFLKRSSIDGNVFFLFDPSVDRLVVPDPNSSLDLRKIVDAFSDCRGKVVSTVFRGQPARLYCDEVSGSALPKPAIFFQLDTRTGPGRSFYFGLAVVILGVLLFSMWYALNRVLRLAIVAPMQALRQDMTSEIEQLNGGDGDALSVDDQVENEIEAFKKTFDKLIVCRRDAIELEKRYLQEKAQMDTARQVAHDIGSPLTALNLVLPELSKLDEKYRVLVRAAVRRIQDICNGLEKKGRAAALPTGAESAMIMPIVEACISEKRVELRAQSAVRLMMNTESVYDVFVRVNRGDLSRILSNLINNAVEALESDVGEVTVNCFADSKFCMIAVTDNGKGIPPEILERIFDKGFSFGKERTQQAGGSGLGLAHARETLRRIDGRIEINSKVDVGTQVVVTLPRAEAPAWFLSSLDLTRGSKVVVLDDDDSIHEVWRARLGMDVEVLSFFDAQLLVEAHQRGLRADRYLIDYELLNQKWNGLQVIRTLEIQDYAVLVTSHLEVDVVAVCLDTSIKLLPKSMAKDVPLALQDSAAQIR